MANDYSNVIPQLLAEGVMALRENSVMPRLVNRSYEPTPSEKGQTVDIPIPSAITATDVSPATTPQSPSDSSPTRAQMTLDQWKKADFYVTDKELQEIQEGTIPMQASECVKALANIVDDYILALYKTVYGVAGVAGTTPFASGTSEFAAALKILQDQLAPKDSNIRSVVGTAAWANAIQLRAFQDASYGGGAQGILEAQIGRKMGADWFVDQNVPTHTKGTLDGTTGTGQALVNGAVAAGAATFDVDDTTLSGTIVPGDVFTVAGDSQTYAITNTTAQTAASEAITGLTFSPTAQQAWTDNSVITLKGNHVVNMVFHRDAFAFASRPLASGNVPALGVDVDSIVDPVSGLVLRVQLQRQWMQTAIIYDLLYGAVLVRPQLATRLAG